MRDSREGSRTRGRIPIVFAAALLVVLIAGPACRGGSAAHPTATPAPNATVQPTPPASQSPAPGSQAATTFDMASASALTTVYGRGSGDFLSDIPALAAGDFNADGFADFVVGARFADGPANDRQDAGAAYVIFGAADPPASVDIAAGEQGLTIYGGAPGANLGFSAAAGDVNGDGTDDILVGAPLGSDSGGAVYVIFGRSGLGGTVDTAAGQQDATILGPGGNAFFGDSLALGDVNDDGGLDIIVGSTFADDPGAGTLNAGAVFVFLGSRGLSGTMDAAGRAFDAVLYAADPLDELGDNVASGDVNGDGIDDIVATAEAADGPNNDRDVAAEVHVLYGRRQLAGEFRIAQGQDDVTVYGAEAHDTLGFAVAAGDLDGDGIDDIVMGARLADGPNNSRDSAGETYVLYGSRHLPDVVDLAQDAPVLTLYGADPSDFFGSFVAVVDLDDDGAGELLLGAGFAGGPGNQRLNGGEAYVLNSLPDSGALDMASVHAAIAVFGAQAGDDLGAALAAGDFNGDGRLDLAVLAAGAPARSGAPQGARLYVLPLPAAD